MGGNSPADSPTAHDDPEKPTLILNADLERFALSWLDIPSLAKKETYYGDTAGNRSHKHCSPDAIVCIEQTERQNAISQSAGGQTANGWYDVIGERTH